MDKTQYLSRISWEVVCSSSRGGGLGFRKIPQWNLTFMAKLGWSIIRNDDKLWVKLMKARYWSRGSFLNAQAKNHHSPIWKDIVRGREILEKGLKKRIGDGRGSSLWLDWWVGEAPLIKVTSSSVPDFMLHWRVSNIISNGKWDIGKIRDLIPEEYCKGILRTPLPLFEMVKDVFIWAWEKRGSFSVRSAYRMQCGTDVGQGQGSNWGQMWSMSAPFKYKLLFWNLMHKIIPTAVFLANRIPNFDVVCVQCGQASESLLHLFRDCRVPRIMWTEATSTMPPDLALIFFSLDWDGWLGLNLS